jgi:ABC-type oligopeptide transport system substrate-binding subunit
MAHLFSGLVALSPDMSIVPDLAQSWEVTRGGRCFLFHLRTDARWRDGLLVTAHDFEYAWKRILDPATGSTAASFLYDLKGARAFHQGQGPRDQVGVRALNDFTLLVELAHPVGYFLPLITHVAWRPAPRRVVERWGPAWARSADLVSNGPFFLTSWEPGRRLILSRNPHYHGRFNGNLQQVVLLSIPDWETRLQLYEAGELDVLGVTYLDAQNRESLLRRRAGELIARPQLDTNFLSFDVTRPPFDDKQARRAFALAISRRALADEVLQGYAAPATGGLTPPNMPGHVPDIAPPYDPMTARELLPRASDFSQLTMLAYEAVADRARFLSASWQEGLGVTVQLELASWPEFLASFQSHPYHIIHLGWRADYPDPDNFLRVSRARAWPWWHHADYDQYIQQARAMTDPQGRMTLYRQAETILAQELPILPLIYEQEHLLIQSWVRRYPMSGLRPACWTDVVMTDA